MNAQNINKLSLSFLEGELKNNGFFFFFYRKSCIFAGESQNKRFTKQLMNMKKILFLAMALMMCMGMKAQNAVDLPQPEIGKLSMPLGKILQERRSVREYQKEMIDLQTLVNRRDVAYSTASGVVRSNGQTMSQDAQNFI